MNSFYVDHPRRLVVDVTGALLVGGKKSIETDTRGIRRIRLAQNSRNPDIVRIVFDLKTNIEPNVVLDEKAGTVEVTEPLVSKQFPDLMIKKLKDRVEIVIPLGAAAEFTKEQVIDPPRFVLDFKDYVPRKSSMVYKIEEGLAERVRVSRFKSDPYVTRMVVDTALPAKIEVEKRDGGKKIIVSVFQASLYKKTVCIDPGHGGKDPGAQVAGYPDEKEIVLNVGLRLRELLKKAGANVIMTRDRDVFVPLEDRAKLANRKHAKVFLSIHANALAKHQYKQYIRGIQTFHYKSGGKKLAGIMKNALSATLATGDWGIYDRKYVVLTHTRMRATLVEIGFMTHPDEIELLTDDTFRENAARGLYNGLEEYFGGRGEQLAALELSPEMVAHLPDQPFQYEYVASGNVLLAGSRAGEDVSGRGVRRTADSMNIPNIEDILPANEMGLTHEVVNETNAGPVGGLVRSAVGNITE